MRILFLSTHNFATNPRLVKEIDLALRNNYEVSVVCCEFENWSKPINDKIIARLKPLTDCTIIPAGRKPFFGWLGNSVLFSASRYLLKLFPQNDYLLSLRSNKRSSLLLSATRKIKNRADLVVAHNPGSFYPAMRYAKAHNISFGVDLEDYHPGETNDIKSGTHFRELSKKTLPHAKYLSAASPLILDYTLRDIGPTNAANFVVLNYFPKEEFMTPREVADDRLQLVWFSQYISHGRGLEEILPVVRELSSKVQLHLYGNLNEDFNREWLSGISNIVIHPPQDQPALHAELALYDIGLALENPSSNLNRELCITNKILSYYEAGLYILASVTKAQEDFIDQHPHAGTLSTLSSDALSVAIKKLFTEKHTIRLQKQARFRAAANASWNTEAEKLVDTWNRLLT